MRNGYIVRCTYCNWNGEESQLNIKQVIYPVEEGVPACPQCGSHTHLEYVGYWSETKEDNNGTR